MRPVGRRSDWPPTRHWCSRSVHASPLCLTWSYGSPFAPKRCGKSGVWHNEPLLWTGPHASVIVLPPTLLGMCVTRHRASSVMQRPQSGMDLAIPTLLTDLIAAGVWPADSRSAMRQNLRSLIPPERVRRFAPEEDKIYLQAPPFITVAREVAASSAVVLRDYWERFGALDQIVPEQALILGDFGLGSDAPIVLNFAADPLHPPVFRLRWGPDQRNKWVQGASTFEEFVNILGAHRRRCITRQCCGRPRVAS